MPRPKWVLSEIARLVASLRPGLVCVIPLWDEQAAGYRLVAAHGVGGLAEEDQCR